MTSQLIDLVNTTNNIVYQNLQKLNSKFKNIIKDQIIDEEEEYDSLNCKINIYFSTIIEQMKTKFILAIQEYEEIIEQNNKDILELMMENMLLKIEKDSLLEEKIKNKLYMNDYTENKKSINAKKINSKKRTNNQNIISNTGIYSLIKSEFNNDINNKNNIQNNINGNNIYDIINNKNGSKKKKKSNSYNKFNNNNYNFNIIGDSRLDFNNYHSQNKANISYNTQSKALYDSQENLNCQKNKNSFSLKDFSKIKNAFSLKRTKKSSNKKNKNKNIIKRSKILKSINKFKKDNKDQQNISFSGNKIQFTESSYQEHNKKKEKIDFYLIKKIKEEMNEILKNKKSIHSSNNNSNNHINTSGNIIDNSSNNKIKLSMGYKYKHPKNNISINLTVNKKLLQNKTPKNIKTPLHNNLSGMIISYASKDNKYRKNFICGNNGNINQKISPSNKKQNIFGKFNNKINSNINLDNHSISTYQKKDLSNNLTSLKNLKRNNSNSKSYYKSTITKIVSNGNNSNKKSYKEKNYLNYCYFNDNINNNISYNLGNKNTIISRNQPNYGIYYNNFNTYYSNNNFKTINNFNKKNSNSNSNLYPEEINNINNTKLNTNCNENNPFSMKIRNKINLNKSKVSQCLNRNVNNDKNKKTIINKSSSYLLVKEIDCKKTNIKRPVCLNDENNKNETPSFFLYKNKK